MSIDPGYRPLAVAPRQELRHELNALLGNWFWFVLLGVGLVVLGTIALGSAVVAFSAEMRRNDRAFKDFLLERMYRHYRVNRMSSKARRVVHDLFTLYLAEPQCLPREWRELSAGPDEPQTARVVADYLAGMTDRFALDEHQRVLGTAART